MKGLNTNFYLLGFTLTLTYDIGMLIKLMCIEQWRLVSWTACSLHIAFDKATQRVKRISHWPKQIHLSQTWHHSFCSNPEVVDSFETISSSRKKIAQYHKLNCTLNCTMSSSWRVHTVLKVRQELQWWSHCRVLNLAGSLSTVYNSSWIKSDRILKFSRDL